MVEQRDALLEAGAGQPAAAMDLDDGGMEDVVCGIVVGRAIDVQAQVRPVLGRRVLDAAGAAHAPRDEGDRRHDQVRAGYPGGGAVGLDVGERLVDALDAAVRVPGVAELPDDRGDRERAQRHRQLAGKPDEPGEPEHGDTREGEVSRGLAQHRRPPPAADPEQQRRWGERPDARDPGLLLHRGAQEARRPAGALVGMLGHARKRRRVAAASARVHGSGSARRRPPRAQARATVSSSR